MVKHTQTIRKQITDELFECFTIPWGWRLNGQHLYKFSFLLRFLHKNYLWFAVSNIGQALKHSGFLCQKRSA